MNHTFATVSVRLLGATAVALAIASCAPSEAELVAANDRGVGLMGRYEYAAAEQVFAEVVAAAPDWLDARVNLAIATLNRQQEGDEVLALDMLGTVLKEQGDHARALYSSAILLLNQGDAAPAAQRFRRVTELDPADAYAAYFLGQALLQQGDYAAAAEWMQRSAGLDPYLRSAYWAGSLALRRLGRDEEAADMLANYQRMEANPAARLAEISYKRMGPKAEALATTRTPPPMPTAPQGPLFAAPITIATPASGPALTSADVNGDGIGDLALVGSASPAIFLGTGDGGFAHAADHPLSAAAAARAALWGDIDDDGLVDVVLCGPSGARFWRQGPRDAWTRTVDLDDEACRAGALFDADHDGDLDVFTIGADRVELHSNNRDGSFRRLAAELGMAAGDGRQVLVADLDGDRDLDILLLRASPPHEIWRNDRTWQYQPLPGLEELRQEALLAVTAADADADGHREIYGAAADGALLRWRFDGLSWQRDRVLPGAPAPWAELDFADFDGDGRGELLRVLPDKLDIVDSRTGARLHEQAVDGLATAIAVSAASRDRPYRGPSLVTADAAGIRIWPPGAGRHGFLALRPTGRSEAAQMRSNASGIGTLVKVRAAGRWTVHDALDSHSAPGQSLQPLSIGLGDHPQADIVALDWSDGVSQSELDLAAGEVHIVEETQRQLASCPVLFAWDGQRFRFVGDVLGGAALGYLSAPGSYAPPRPLERFLLDEAMLKARAGHYRLKLAEPMEETAYLDSASLTVYDLPPGWDMVLDERLAVGGAPATGAPIFFREQHTPAKVVTATGDDVTVLATTKDHRAPPPGDLDRRFVGLLAKDQVLTLEFDAPLPVEDAVLVADGWIGYPYSQTVFAAWQAGLRYRPATLEARAGDGVWQPLAEEFGYPAGMPRSMALPLPLLPAGTQALRLTSNIEIYWDRLRVVRAEPLANATRQTLAPATARIARTGFAKRSTGPQRQPHYDYHDRATYWDAKAARGFYTALGDAVELVAERDDALAIFGSGEEIHLEFAAAPAPPAGHRRYYAIEFHGWAKDMDLYTRHGDTVAPLPGNAAADRRKALHRRYNVRFRGGL